ncbi:Hypothetical Protein FCC1311_076262 [Hondaea fermentalgiana]|uniref:BHLH domain-containing protein n=1 Tax=Hondaea fermentalgiana TaxID=2315210 RepID=A0A2R5GKG7_9STRA|nr:Hypothetical Protein FCC1311_076262 [Hondaea fermentalgiana]|eukprot:GBG31402.1 Hypothetical Protein FCC1311_076262 [Hondaea fermentalgiana]
MAPKHDSKTESGSRWSIEEGHSSGLSFSGLRWSLDEVRGAFSRSKSKSGGKKRNKGKKDLSQAEREKRRQERLKARKEKKSKREKERRNQVNGLLDQLGDMVEVDKSDGKGARLEVLGAAVDKLKDKKGISRGKRSKYDEYDEDDYDDDYDYDDDDDDDKYSI